MTPAELDAEVLGTIVSRRRAELGLTQQQAAEQAGVAVTTWRMIEGGRQSNFRTLTLAAVARALGWTVDQLMRGEGPSTAHHAPAEPFDVQTLEGQLGRLDSRDLLLVRTLVDRLLDDRPRP
jgi:transcriptional regulator with XRE-family HTH domain